MFLTWSTKSIVVVMGHVTCKSDRVSQASSTSRPGVVARAGLEKIMSFSKKINKSDFFD